MRVVVRHAVAADGPFRPAEAKVEAAQPYLIALPDGYTADPTDRAHGGHGWPLVLFLHGAGERGSNLADVTRIGLPKLIADGKKYPFAVVAPQCPVGGWWDAFVLHGLVLDVQKQYGFDPDRTYVTGLSMGGFGTWDLITRYPGLFAAAAPICGGGDAFVAGYTARLKHLPVWAFHGEADPVVPVARTREMVATLRSLHNPDLKETIYPGVGHDSWNKAYAEPELFPWLLAQHRGTPTTQPK